MSDWLWLIDWLKQQCMVMMPNAVSQRQNSSSRSKADIHQQDSAEYRCGNTITRWIYWSWREWSAHDHDHFATHHTTPLHTMSTMSHHAPSRYATHIPVLSDGIIKRASHLKRPGTWPLHGPPRLWLWWHLVALCYDTDYRYDLVRTIWRQTQRV